MFKFVNALAATAVSIVCATGVSAQTARDIRGPTELVAIQDEAPAKLVVDPPPSPISSPWGAS